MNTAACLVSDARVLPLESVADQPARPAAELPPPLPDVSLKVPSDRDLQIYESAVFAGRSQREVAKEFGVSQPRVNQILKEMAAWMADNTPAFAAGLTPEQKLRLVHYNVTQQLEYQRCVLMEAWEASRTGTETISRTTIVDNVRRTTAYNRPRSGNVRFMNAASRVSLAIARLAGWTPRVVVPDAPQDSPWWQMGEEGVGSGQEAEGGRQEAVGSRQQEESKNDLSSWEERAKNPNLTRAEMDAITAEQQTVIASLEARLEQLNQRKRETENTLSLGAGPLLPEERNGARRTRKEDKKRGERRDFLRGESPVKSISDFLRPPPQPCG